jgi:hypothetical protein
VLQYVGTAAEVAGVALAAGFMAILFPGLLAGGVALAVLGTQRAAGRLLRRDTA